ncbi:MAG: antibiotic biosynthesis monooxygenase [Trueperaceae bacterium]|nr:antibiotic biosynthesis monooxygenase [Trueperaceae bacterium]
MISVANRIYVSPDYTEAFEARFRDRAGLVDQMPGFMFNQVLRPTKPDDPYVVLTYWESYEKFRAWVESDAFKEGHAKSGSLPPEAFPKRNQLEIHQVVMDSRDPDLAPDEPLELTSFH